jgi:hypothetical protein
MFDRYFQALPGDAVELAAAPGVCLWTFTDTGVIR